MRVSIILWGVLIAMTPDLRTNHIASPFFMQRFFWSRCLSLLDLAIGKTSHKIFQFSVIYYEKAFIVHFILLIHKVFC